MDKQEDFSPLASLNISEYKKQKHKMALLVRFLISNMCLLTRSVHLLFFFFSPLSLQLILAMISALQNEA